MNEYEQAFESWLKEHKLRYVPVDQQKRAVFKRIRIKSFDFLVHPQCSCRSSFPQANQSEVSPIIVEVKGRLFKGASIADLKNIQCWVTMEDIRGLWAWQEAFDSGPVPYHAYFVFAFRLENPFSDTLTSSGYEYGSEVFYFFAVSLEDYIKHMTVRSKSWQTVTLSTADFRRFSIPAAELFCRMDDNERNYTEFSRVCS